MNQQLKDRLRQREEAIRKQQQDNPMQTVFKKTEPITEVRPGMTIAATAIPDGLTDDIVIEITGNSPKPAVILLRPSELDRVKSRYGKGPGFEQWLAKMLRDHIIAYGGG